MLAPQDEGQLAEAIKAATGPLRIRGGGTRPIGAPISGEVLDTRALSGIELYEPGALTIVAKAGTPLAEVEAALDAENQRLPFEPMDHRALLGTEGTSTIGGVVAANVSGPRRIQVGACRDSLIGVRFVDGQGNVLKNGGRVMKNVTGYDLVKLMCGAHGTLGVLTEVSFKVLPKTAATAVLSLTGLSVAQAVGVLSRALSSPFEVSGAAHVTQGQDGGPVTLLRLEGFEAQVSYRTDKLRALLANAGDISVETDAAQTAARWAWVRDVQAFAGRDGDVWRLSVKPSDGPEAAARLAALDLVMDWGGGLIWALMPAGADVRAKLGDLPGHATLVRAAPETRAKLPVFAPEPAAIATLSTGLRAKFDPRGLLNPGLMG